MRMVATNAQVTIQALPINRILPYRCLLVSSLGVDFNEKAFDNSACCATHALAPEEARHEGGSKRCWR